MRVKEKIKKSGYFWLPSVPEKTIAGTLNISDGGKIELEVAGLFDGNLGGGTFERFERIVGQIEKYGYITLDDCLETQKTISFVGISKSLIHVRMAFLGVAYDEREPVLLNTFQFSVEGIDEWVGLSGIKVENQFEKQAATITYSRPENVSLNLNNGMKFLITFSWTFPGFPNLTEAKITQKTWFKLVSEQDRPLKDFISTAHKITTLLCFAIDKTVCIDQIETTSNTISREINTGESKPAPPMLLYYASLPYIKDEPKIYHHHMLFRYQTIKANAEQIINN